jgi:L-ascorbate metabolism protein UlaG (beta-lactamase superfamily)
MNADAENPTDEETFSEAREILITHGHFDHLMSIPEFNSVREIRVHCTETPRETLLKCGMPEQRIHQFSFGQTVEFDDAKVRVFKGKHNKIDSKIAIATTLRVATSIRRIVDFFNIVAVHKRFPEAEETVMFEVKSGNERVQIIGSPNVCEDAVLPEMGADLLVLPFNGTSNPTSMAMHIVETYRPKAVLLSHFDNAFPPMTAPVKIQPFIAEMRRKYPDIPVHIPTFGETFLVSSLAVSSAGNDRPVAVESTQLHAHIA